MEGRSFFLKKNIIFPFFIINYFLLHFFKGPTRTTLVSPRDSAAAAETLGSVEEEGPVSVAATCLSSKCVQSHDPIAQFNVVHMFLFQAM